MAHQSDGRDPHDAAAALAVVQRLVDGPHARRPERGQAGVAGGAQVVERADADEPAVGSMVAPARAALALRRKPPRVGVIDDARRVAQTADLPTYQRPDKALDGEERH